MHTATSDTERLLLGAFTHFLQNVIESKRSGNDLASALWIEAASHLHSTEARAVEGLITWALDRGLDDQALLLAEAHVALAPGAASAHFMQGVALQRTRRHAKAVAAFRRAFALAPDYPYLRNNLAATLLSSRDKIHEAAALLESAVKATPDDGNAWMNLAHCRLYELDLNGAIDANQRAVALMPTNALALSNQANLLKEAQRWDEAEELASRACHLAPDNPLLQMNLGLLHLLRGNYDEGWRKHEARWQGSPAFHAGRPILPGRQWSGEPLRNKVLLLWGEQGMGDVLQLARYVPMLAERVRGEGGRLVWNSFPQMGKLLERSFANDIDSYSNCADLLALPPFDYEVAMMSLPLIFETNAETIPCKTPYLVPDAAIVQTWRKRLATEKRFKVGLTWTGGHANSRNPFRMVGLAKYAKHLGEVQNAAFYSLQPQATADIKAAREAGFPIEDFTDELRTFDDTAAFVAALDLVITVCTSVSHLSGAIGKRFWVLLDVNPHWVWQLRRRDCVWYPTATLYRQHRFADWDPVLTEVSRDLAALTKMHD